MCRKTCGVLVGLLILAVSVWAGEPSPEDRQNKVSEALHRFEQALQQEENLSEEFKSALHELVLVLKESPGQARKPTDTTTTVSRPAPAPAAPEKPRLSWSGDVRLRAESNVNLNGGNDRHRQRLRFRLGAHYRFSKQLTLDARLVTGNPDDPNSTHQTLGSGLDAFEVSLDRLYLTYKPQWAPGVWFKAGKFGHPFVTNPVVEGLAWDGDVQGEGLAFGLNVDMGKARFGFRAADYLLVEQKNGPESQLLSAQADISGPLGDSWQGRFALGYYHYGDTTPGGSQSLIADNAGNALVDMGGGQFAYASDFDILNPMLSFVYSGWDKPLTLSAEYLHNSGAVGDRDAGYSVGVSLGDLKARGHWKAYYGYARVEQEAVFSGFAQDDFLYQTNHRSHQLGVRYKLSKRSDLHLYGLVSRLDAVDTVYPGWDDDQWRLRLDLNLKF